MKIINIGILAHVDAGKTTLTESLLYTSGAIEAPGSVDQGTTRTDTMFLERQRGITIQTAVTSFQWHDCKVNIVDTPGHMDFLAEVYRSLAILDGAILVVSAKDGVQAQTRILFHALQVMKIPTVIFINKIDQDGIDLPGVYQSIRDKLSANMIIKQNVQLSPDISIMENMGLENWDTVIADCDELLEKYIAGEPMDKEELLREENRRIQSVSLFPVYHGSAKVNLGIRQLIEAVTDTFQSPTGQNSSELCGTVFKVEYANQSQRLAYLRLYSGTLHLRDSVALAGKEKLKITEMRMHYNPFAYVHSEKDILKLVTTLMTNTKGEGSGGDPFWEKSERLLLTALIAYLHYEAPVEEQNFATLLEMLNTMQVLEDDEEYQNPVDLLFEELGKKKSNSFAVRQYKLYKLAAGDICSK